MPQSIIRWYFREGKNLPTLDRQFALAREHGAKADDLRGDGGNEIYIDRRPRARQEAPPDWWFSELVRHPLNGGQVRIASPLILGDSPAEIRRRANLIAKAGGVIFSMDEAELVDDFGAGMAFLHRGQDMANKVTGRRLNADKLRSGKKGGKRPEFTDAQIKKLREPWRTASDKDDLVAKAVTAIGRDISASSVRRYAIANKWGERGCDIVKRTPPKPSAKRLKRRPR